jgi:hypothetical protein
MSTEDLKTPDLSSLHLVMVKANHEWKGPYRLIAVDTDNCPFLVMLNETEYEWFPEAKPYTPPTRRPMTHAEVFEAIRKGAVVRHIGCHPANHWSAGNNFSNYEICRSYTGTDSDVWTKMEIEQ